MDKNKLIQRLMATFLEELYDHVGHMNRDLLALEKDPSDEQRAELLQSLLRSAHSLKGASRAVSVEIVDITCHKVEDILSPLRDRQTELTPDLASLLLNTIDAIEDVGTRLRSEQDLGSSPLHDLLPVLDDAIGKIGGTQSDNPDASTSSPTNAAPENLASEDSASRDSPGDETTSPSSAPAADTATPDSSKSSTAPQDATAVDSDHETEKVKVKPQVVSASIRVPAEKLDSLLTQSGELLVARRRVEYRAIDAANLVDSAGSLRNQWRELERPLRALVDRQAEDNLNVAGPLPRRVAVMLHRTDEQVSDLVDRIDAMAADMMVDSRLLSHTCDALDNDVYRVRMLPFAEACSGLERAVRDLAQVTGKRVALVIHGEDVEVDRSVLEGLKDPLIHLVRNAVDHGIESSEDRQASGKPAEATVTVSAHLRGGQIEVAVADDGKGIDLQRVRSKAGKLGLSVPEDDREAARLVFSPGFSTAAIVTDVSGRGVGLDVVESQIESLHGTVDVDFRSGLGTTFTMTVPLTLTTIRCMLAVVGEHQMAIPTLNVKQIVRFDADQLASIGGQDVLRLGGTPIPVNSLASVTGIAVESSDRAGKQMAIIVAAGEKEVALVVDDVAAEQEVLVKNLGPRVRRSRLAAGATLLPSGAVALVLNIPNIVRNALSQSGNVCDNHAPDPERPTSKVRVLAVDDSVTTRTLMKSILESSGYDVTVAADGKQAWELIQSETFDVVVSDVDMPRMDGFQLASAIRGLPSLADLPVVLVTARGTDEDKARGVQVGANAYIVKGSFDQGSLLDVVSQLT